MSDCPSLTLSLPVAPSVTLNASSATVAASISLPSVSVGSPVAPLIAASLSPVPTMTFYAPQGGGSSTSAGVTFLNGLTGILGLVGTGNVFITSNGTNTIWISGSGVIGGGGVSQGQLDSLSGFTINASGALQNQIAGGGSQVRISGSSTLAIADFSGIGGAQIFTSGGRVFISGGAGGGGITQAQLDSLSGWSASAANLQITGSILYSDIVGLSGQASSTYATILNLALTGQQAYALYTGLSGALYQTGSNLYSLIVGLSGQANSAIANTGQAAWISSNGAAGNLSGNLTQTGVALGLLITQTGQSAWTWANGAATIISGNLTQTGIALLAQNLLASGWLQTGITSLSGFTLLMSGALQALIAGGGSIVKVTGSAAIPIADFTGIGGTIVFTSGGIVFISGGAGGAGGGVPSVNSITSAVSIIGTGGISVITVGSNILISGDQSISGALTQTGANLYNMLVAESGTLATVPFKFGLSIDAGTGIVTSGLKGCFQLSAGMRISGWNIVAYSTGILQVDVNRSTLSTFPSFASIITGSVNYPYISGTSTGYSVNLSGWSGVLKMGDYLEFYVRGCTGISKFNVNITGIKS